MPTLPAVIVTLLLPFEHLFDPRMSRASAKRTTGAVDDRPARVAHFTPRHLQKATVTGLDGWFSKYADPHTVNSFINKEAERYRWPADEHQGKTTHDGRLDRAAPTPNHRNVPAHRKKRRFFMSKTAPAQEPKTGHQILLRNRHRGHKYAL